MQAAEPSSNVSLPQRISLSLLHRIFFIAILLSPIQFWGICTRVRRRLLLRRNTLCDHRVSFILREVLTVRKFKFDRRLLHLVAAGTLDHDLYAIHSCSVSVVTALLAIRA